MNIRIGRVERAFFVSLLAYILLSFLPLPGLLALAAQGVVAFLGGWTFVRTTRTGIRQMLWRLRNRLIVAYIFIALVPVVLISTLVGLGASLIGGQLAIHTVTSELDRRTAALQSTAEYLARHRDGRSDWVQNVAPYLRERYPGLELTVQDSGRWTWPPEASVPPVKGWSPGSGLALRDGVLFGWAHAQTEESRVTAAFPITREFLGLLAPEMCESTLLDLNRGRAVLAPSLAEAGPSRNRLPPPVNGFDFEIRWGAPVAVHYWDNQDQKTNEWLTVRTRPSAILQTIFAQELDWPSQLIPTLFFSVAILFFIAELIALIVGISLTRTITGAIHDLYEGTLRVRSGNFAHKIPIHGRDQLAELAISFNHMTDNVQRLLEIEKEGERLQSELEIAREVQNQLYPKKVPEAQSLQLTAACSPARMVSGDYYDYQQIGADKVAIAIGDVAGKGISAALLMATVQSSFRSHIRGSLEMAHSAAEGRARVGMSTSALVSRLNQQLFADTSPEKYATFYVGVYDEPTGMLTYTNAGHLPPILVQNGRAHRLEVNGMVVGAFPFASYGESKVELYPGDLLVFFTDGITEPENEYGEMFGEDRLEDLSVRNAHLDTPQIISCIMDSVREWTGSDELQDDMTLLIVRRR